MNRLWILALAFLTALALLTGTLADEVVSPEVERAVEVQEFDLTGEADAGEADIAAAATWKSSGKKTKVKIKVK